MTFNCLLAFLFYMQLAEFIQKSGGLIDKEDIEFLNNFSWCLNSSGYAVTNLKEDNKYKVVYLHRLLMKNPEKMDVDHKNGNKLDNQRENLRICSRKQNTQNRHKKVGDTSKFKGVYWFDARNKWVSRITVDGKMKHLGVFNDETQAAKTYDEFAKIYFGEYAFTNF